MRWFITVGNDLAAFIGYQSTVRIKPFLGAFVGLREANSKRQHRCGEHLSKVFSALRSSC